MNSRLVTILATVVVTLAACGGSDDSSTEVAAADTSTTNPPITEPSTTDAPTTEGTTTEISVAEVPATDPADSAVADAEGWVAVEPEGDCVCADGSDFEFWERPGDPTKVVLFFEGGGACFSAGTCDFETGTYTSSLTLGESGIETGGVFDRSNPENPLADHTFVYVPYCSGDVFLGEATTEYGPDLAVQHNGFNNASEGLNYIFENYSGVEQLVVTGVSAGSIPTPLFAGLAADGLPDAEIITFGDGSAAYPDIPLLNETIGELWGTTKNIPDWPVNEGLTVSDWSLPGLYVQAGLHAPSITFGRFDYAFDATQASFGALAGVPANELVTLIDGSEEQIEAQGVPIASYVAPGTAHTILWSDDLYLLEVEGVRLIDFLGALVAGEVPADVHCVDCGAP